MPRNVRTPLLAAIACAALLAPLAVAAYSYGPVQRFDLRILLHLDREAGTRHDIAASLVNLGGLGSLLAMLAVIIVLAVQFGRRREAIAAVIVVAGANLTTQLFKATFEHARPEALAQGIDLPWPNSFPSGHTTAAASIAAALLLVVPAAHRLWAAIAGGLITAAVGVSVIVLGWHYPSDVLGALLMVGAWTFAAVAVLRLRIDRGGSVSVGERHPPRHPAVSTD